MKQLHFETKERAEELLTAAIAIWKSNHQYEDISGVERDPIFKLLLTALAYQEGGIESSWESYKRELYDTLFEELSPTTTDSGFMPATVILRSKPHKDLQEVELSQRDTIKLSGSSLKFLPLMRCRIVNHTLKSVTRIDNRRWKIILTFSEPISSLRGLTFQILNTQFRDLRVSYKRDPVELVKPWDIAGLPLQPCFASDSMLYPQSLRLDNRMLWFDLFAQHNARLFIFKRDTVGECESVELTFEFISIAKDFNLTANDIVFNVFPAVNASIESVDLSPSQPLQRIDDSHPKRVVSFILDSSEQDISREVSIRRVATQRFGIEQLLELSHELVQRFSSDFNAFQSIENLREGGKIKELNTLLNAIKTDLDRANPESHSAKEGLYAMLRHKEGMEQSQSVKLSYILSDENALSTIDSLQNPHFSTQSNLNAVETQIVIKPRTPSLPTQGERSSRIEARYRVATGGRIVTPSDIKHFCINELLQRYSVVESLISSIDVRAQLRHDELYCGHEIGVTITLANNSYIQKKIAPNISFIELLMQKMAENRSAGVYPISLSINIEDNSK